MALIDVLRAAGKLDEALAACRELAHAAAGPDEQAQVKELIDQLQRQQSPTEGRNDRLTAE